MKRTIVTIIGLVLLSAGLFAQGSDDISPRNTFGVGRTAQLEPDQVVGRIEIAEARGVVVAEGRVPVLFRARQGQGRAGRRRHAGEQRIAGIVDAVTVVEHDRVGSRVPDAGTRVRGGIARPT